VNAILPAESLREALAFTREGEPAGNVSVGHGLLEGRRLRCAFVENRTASGALGTAECGLLGGLFDALARRPEPLVLFLDSAGAKVSEGLPALGAFRRLYASGLAAVNAGVPIAAALGTNCFGGASMVAHLARARLFSPRTRLAMSGPAILAASAGMAATDEAFAAMAQASISATARARASTANTVWDEGLDVRSWLGQVLGAASAPSPLAQALASHRDLGIRLGAEAEATPGARGIDRKLFDALFPGGWNLDEADGVLSGTGRGAAGDEAVVGLVRRAPVGAAAAWRFADAAWNLVRETPARVRVLLDCATHAARLEDERLVLSEYIVDMARALAAVARQSALELTVTGEAGGGVYVALAGPAPRVTALHNATIRVLPHAAIAAILGEDRDSAPEASAYAAAGVAEEVLRLGLVP
jgi:hypothetical protein